MSRAALGSDDGNNLVTNVVMGKLEELLTAKIVTIVTLQSAQYERDFQSGPVGNQHHRKNHGHIEIGFNGWEVDDAGNRKVMTFLRYHHLSVSEVT